MGRPTPNAGRMGKMGKGRRPGFPGEWRDLLIISHPCRRPELSGDGRGCQPDAKIETGLRLRTKVSKRVYIAGTVDTKGAELSYLGDIVRANGLDAAVVDLSTASQGGVA